MEGILLESAAGGLHRNDLDSQRNWALREFGKFPRASSSSAGRLRQVATDRSRAGVKLLMAHFPSQSVYLQTNGVLRVSAHCPLLSAVFSQNVVYIKPKDDDEKVNSTFLHTVRFPTALTQLTQMSKLKALSRVSTTVIELTGSVERVVSGNPLCCGCASCSSIRLPRGVCFRPTSESV